MALDFSVENRSCVCFFNFPSKRGSECARRRRSFQKLSDRRCDISVASAGAEQSPALSSVNSDHLANCSHAATTLDTQRLTGQAERESCGFEVMPQHRLAAPNPGTQECQGDTSAHATESWRVPPPAGCGHSQLPRSWLAVFR